MGQLSDGLFLCLSAEAKQNEVALYPAPEHPVGGNGRVEATGHQHQCLILGAQRETADARRSSHFVNQFSAVEPQ